MPALAVPEAGLKEPINSKTNQIIVIVRIGTGKRRITKLVQALKSKRSEHCVNYPLALMLEWVELFQNK